MGFVLCEPHSFFKAVVATLSPVGSAGNSEALFEAVFKVVTGVETTDDMFSGVMLLTKCME